MIDLYEDGSVFVNENFYEFAPTMIFPFGCSTACVISDLRLGLK